MQKDQRKKNIVVFGGYGFVGSAIVRAYLQSPDYDIYLIDKLETGISTSSVQKHPRVKFLNHDINHINEYCDRLPGKADCIINCASNIANIGVSYDNHSLRFCVDALTRDFAPEAITKEKEIIDNAFVLAESLEVGKIVNLSTYLVYENSSGGFGGFKKEIETYIKDTYCDSSFIIARLPLQFGIFQNCLQFISSVILQLLNEKSLMIDENQDNFYQWSYVDDTAILIKHLLSKSRPQGVYDIPGIGLSVYDMCSKIFNIIGDENQDIRYTGAKRKKERIKNAGELIINHIHQMESMDERLALAVEFYEDNLDYYLDNFKKYIAIGN